MRCVRSKGTRYRPIGSRSGTKMIRGKFTARRGQTVTSVSRGRPLTRHCKGDDQVPQMTETVQVTCYVGCVPDNLKLVVFVGRDCALSDEPK